jgi:hypothetical protein
VPPVIIEPDALPLLDRAVYDPDEHDDAADSGSYHESKIRRFSGAS